ncbi:hypothetical protein SFUMM280S_07372 [Streptomyces fumanus]
MSTVLLLSTADTDLLAARAATGVSYRIGNPTRVDVAEELPGLIEGADIAVVRLLGGKRAWEDGLAALKAAGLPTVLLGGESVPDAELMAELPRRPAWWPRRCATSSRAAPATSPSSPGSSPTPCC